jgi:hypothetical protein
MGNKTEILQTKPLTEKEVNLIRQFRYATNAWDYYVKKSPEIEQKYGKNSKQYWINREKAHYWQNEYDFLGKLLNKHHILLNKIQKG